MTTSTTPTLERIPYTACPLCGTDASRATGTGDCSRHPLYCKELPAEIRWKQCAACLHIFTEGYFSDAACTLLFSKINPNQQVGYDLERQRYLSARMVDKVLPFATSGYWLDVGFGNGSLLFTVHEYGFIPVGVDLRRENAQRMADFGIRTYCEDITRLSLEFECAVISMADVLEHMPFPREGLRAAHRLLTSGGVLLLSMPNCESAIWRALDDNKANPYWGELEHYHNFSRSRLFSLLEEHGFKPLRYGISERYRASMEIIARKA